MTFWEKAFWIRKARLRNLLSIAQSLTKPSISYLISVFCGLIIKLDFLSLVPMLPVCLWRASCHLAKIIAVQVSIHAMLTLVTVRRQSSFPLSDMFASTRTATATTTARAVCGCIVWVFAVFPRSGPRRALIRIVSKWAVWKIYRKLINVNSYYRPIIWQEAFLLTSFYQRMNDLCFRNIFNLGITKDISGKKLSKLEKLQSLVAKCCKIRKI